MKKPDVTHQHHRRRRDRKAMAMAIGIAIAGNAAAQETSDTFPAFVDGASVPQQYVDPSYDGPVHVGDDAVEGYARLAANDYCSASSAAGACSFRSVARRTVPGTEPNFAHTELDVTVDITDGRGARRTYVSNFGILVVRSCPDDAVLTSESGSLLTNRSEATGRQAVACTSPDALPETASLGTPHESGANQCPIGNAPTVGNPLNPLTLSKIETVVDYAGRTTSGLMFARTYHSGIFSLDGKFSQFGRYPAGARIGARWRHSWDRAFVRRPFFDRPGFIYATALYLIREDGGEVRFEKKGDTYIPAAGERGTLREHPDGGWIYTWPDLTNELFDDQGRLRARTDPNGNTVTLHYDEITVGIGLKAKVLTRVSDRQGRELVLSYDRLGRLETVDQPDGGRIKYSYSGDILEGLDANLVKVTYPGGRTVQYLYDEPANGGSPNHKLTGIVGGDGQRYASFYYDGNRAVRSTHGNDTEETSVRLTNGIIEVTEGSGVDAANQSWAPTYDQGIVRLGERTEVFRREDVTRTFDYLGAGLVSRQTDYLGIATSYRYDPKRQVEVERTEADGTPVARTIKTTWHPVFDKPTRIDEGARSITFEYGDRGNILERREAGLSDAADLSSAPWPTERITRFSYDSEGRPQTVDGPLPGNGDTTRYDYYLSDAAGCATGPVTCTWRKGDLHSTTNALGQALTIAAYDGAGRVSTSIDTNGVHTAYTYDTAGRPAEVAIRARRDGAPSAQDIITKVTYNANGDIDSVTDSDGTWIRYRYNDAHRLAELVDALGNRHVVERDARAFVSKDRYVRADGTEDMARTYDYDEHGVLEYLTTESNGTSRYDYDANGRYRGRESSIHYKEVIDRDGLGRVSAVTTGTGAAANTSRLTYDLAGQVDSVVDPKGLSTAYLRNGLGDLLWQHSPDTGDTRLEHDDAGNPVKQIPADGRSAERKFDALGRVTHIAYSDGATTTYAYDTPANACLPGADFAVGRLSEVIDRDGATSFCYDFAGRVLQKIQKVRGVSLEVRYTYTVAGRLASVRYPGGRTLTYGRDIAGNVTHIDSSTGTGAAQAIASDVSHDAAGHLTGWTAGGRRVHRLYNSGGYLSDLGDGKDGLKGQLSYWADSYLFEIGAGAFPLVAIEANTANRVTMTADPLGMMQSYTYDKTGNRLSWSTMFTNNRKYEYATDSHHLLVANKVNREYDANGNTTRIGEREFVYDAAGRMTQAKVNGIVEMNYAYNPFGHQIARYIAGSTTLSLHDEVGHWLGDYDAAGQPLREVVWLDNLPVAVFDGEHIRDIQPDHLGTPRVIVDRARDKVIWRWGYASEAFGSDAPKEDPDGDGTKYVFDMRFPGQRYDPVTGLFQNGWRDYDPTSGRYIQSDPIGLAGGISTYAYVQGNPYVRADPQGLDDSQCMFNPSACGWNKAPQESNVSFGAGAWGNLLAGYGAAEIGIALDSTPNVCAYRQMCAGVAIGLPVQGELAFVGGAGTGKLSSGSSITSGINLITGAAFAGGAQILGNEDGFSISKGMFGLGGSPEGCAAGVAAVKCETKYWCAR